MVDIGAALATCKVSNGEIHFEMNLSNDDLKDVYENLRVAIQDGQLPHYKVIGISYTASGSTAEDYVSKLRGANRSYIETYVQLQQVIFGEVKGECTYAKTLPIWRLVSNDKDIRSDNSSLLWAGSAESVRDSLICDVPILKTKNTGYILSLLVTMGTGFEDLDCQHFFRQIFLGYFSDIVQAFDTLRTNVCGDDYTSLHNPIVLSSVLPAYGMFHSIQILFL